jgi:4-hydroxybenzoate polyprenyltransferase
MLRQIVLWGSFVKFSHTVFALPFALGSMVVASREARGWPGWRVFGLIVVAMVGARTCAMAFNRIVDRRIDARNPRTAGRHLPAGLVGLAGAIGLCLVSGAVLVAAAWGLNDLCFALSPMALFLVCFYSLTKRFTDFTHVWLGLALAAAPVGAWLAVKGRVEFFPQGPGGLNMQASALVPLTLGLAVILWLVGLDMIYATQDYEFDRREGLRSLVVRWGPANALAVAFLSHLFMWGTLLVFGALCRFRLSYWIGMVLILALLLLEHLLARRRDPVSVNTAFFKLNGVLSVTFLVVTFLEVAFPWFRLRWTDGWPG